MVYKLWDKKSPIYDVTAEQSIKNNPLYGSEDSYVFYRDNGSIYDILPISSLPEADTPEARCEAFIAALSPPEPTPTDELAALKAEIQRLASKIAELESR